MHRGFGALQSHHVELIDEVEQGHLLTDEAALAQSGGSGAVEGVQLGAKCLVLDALLDAVELGVQADADGQDHDLQGLQLDFLVQAGQLVGALHDHRHQRADHPHGHQLQPHAHVVDDHARVGLGEQTVMVGQVVDGEQQPAVDLGVNLVAREAGQSGLEGGEQGLVLAVGVD